MVGISRTTYTLCVEILIRLVFFVVFWITEDSEPFYRKIHSEEWWLYKNPRTDSYVPGYLLWMIVTISPILVFVVFSLRNKHDFIQSILGVTICLVLNGVTTNIIKLAVGRPRPDFFERCFPQGEMNQQDITNMLCYGDKEAIKQGRKSFPSGHSSFSWSTMSFIAFYVAGKLHVFNSKGKGQAWRLCAFIIPFLVAITISLSRYADYHHHWQDVTVGSLIGLSFGYLCYRHYYPCLYSEHSHRSYSVLLSDKGRHSSIKRNDELSIHIEPTSPIKLV